MKLIDLSHEIRPDMPLYPGTPKPRISQVGWLEKEGYREFCLQVSSHTGTHLDMPAHMLQQGETLNRADVQRFWGPGLIADCRQCRELITRAHLQEKLAEGLVTAAEKPAYVLLWTGWSEKWHQEEYFCSYPVITEEAAGYLCSLNLKGIGLDTPSVDRADTHVYPRHHQFLERGLVLVENLTALEILAGQPFTFACFPLKISGLDGCPVRAVGIV